MVSSAPVIAAPSAGAAPIARGASRTVLLLAAVAALGAAAFPFAPVTQPQVTYTWTAADGNAAIPLMPYQPVSLRATVSCDAVRATPPGAAVLATVPPRPDPSAQPLSGLLLVPGPAGLDVTSAGLELGVVALPASPCTVTVTSDPRATRVEVDGRTALTRSGDVRPDVAGVFTAVGTGVAATIVADTRYQTTITPLKSAIAVVAVLALLGLLVALGRLDRSHGRALGRLPRGWWRPRPVDLVVTTVLGLWWIVGAITVDDGYISGIIRSRGENGVVGNVYRWLDAPESPFSWYDDVLYGWSQLSPSTVWMRLPSVLLGLLCWAMLSRALLPRLLPRPPRHAAWLAALALLTWWVPMNVGLRPEPWVAAGLLATTLAVERAVATRRVRPLVAGLVVAGVTTAVTPGGLVAVAPFLAGLVPVLRLLRARPDLRGATLVTVLVAAPASALLLMLDDQGLGSMLEAVRVRNVIGGGLPWYGEYQRYANLLSPTDFQGSIGRRAAVLATLLAVAGALWAVRCVRGAGIATGPTSRLAVALLLALAIMTFTPTKWTQHFGDLASTGAALVTVAGIAFARPLLRPRPLTAALAAVTVTGALVLSGLNLWPFVSAWFTPTFSTTAPTVAHVPLATALLGAGLLTVVLLLVRAMWARAAGRPEPTVPRWVPGPVPVIVAVLVVVLALEVGSFTRTALAHRDSYTPAADAVDTVRGDPCGLQRDLGVETDPAAGLLVARSTPATATERPVDVGGTSLPGIGVVGRTTTAWFALDRPRRGLPVVVTTAGSLRPGDAVRLEFGSGDQVVGAAAVTTSAGRDVRVLPPADADSVRLVVDAGASGTSTPAAVTLPRVPRLTPMEQLLPRGTNTILDWPIAFVFPCLNPAPLPLGTASLPTWRIGPPLSDLSGLITYAPGFGGPFAGARPLVTEQRMPTYLAGDPLRDAVQLYRWTPLVPWAHPVPSVVPRDVPGWFADGHTRVPGLDPVGR